MRQLWEGRSGRISTQVLSEFYINATRKLSTPLAREDAWTVVDALSHWNPIAVDVALIAVARTVELRFGLSWWHALIIAAAQRAQCTVLLSEDLQHGQRFGAVTVRNPFLSMAA
ncbi:MAG: PIN domain-containing protein [Polyangiales bacterium]